MSDDGELGRKWPPSGTKWMGPLGNHLRDGGFSELRDFAGLAARVAGEADALPPRTGAGGVVLNVTLRP